MIRKLRVSNYRSLGRDVEIAFGPLTVLVGRNGSGKSNVVDCFQFLADCMHLGLESAITKRHGIAAVRRWSSGHPYNVSFAVELSGAQVTGRYEFELTGDSSSDYRVKREELEAQVAGQTVAFRVEGGEWRTGPEGLRPKVGKMNLALPLLAGDERFGPVADELRGMAVYSIFPDTLRQPQKYDPTKPMERHGANWVSILKDQDEATWKPDLVTVLNKLTGDVVDVRVQPIAGYLAVHFEHEVSSDKRKRFDAAQESDGTLRVAGMLSALLQQPRPSLVALEEPELTVHPGALQLLQDYIREASDDVQVVLTTHSPDLLELLDVESVRVVERRDGQTTVTPLEESQRRVVQEGLFSLGEVLRTEGLRQMELRFPDTAAE